MQPHNQTLKPAVETPNSLYPQKPSRHFRFHSFFPLTKKLKITAEGDSNAQVSNFLSYCPKNKILGFRHWGLEFRV